MTIDNDLSDLAPSPPRRPSRVLTPVVWMWLASCVACIALGSGVAMFGPRLFPPASAPTEAVAPPRPAAPDATPTTPAAAAPAPAPPANAETAALASRLDRLEQGHRALADAASAALAAASLSQAAESGRPFVAELDMLSRLLPDARDLAALRPVAERGAPTRAALIAEFPEMARQAIFAARTPPDGASILVRFSHALSALFTVRRTDRLTGSDPDAIVARAERRMNDGDLDGAVREIDTLPPKGQAAAKTWLDRARSRTEVQRRITAIRLQALRTLSAADREAGL